MGLRSYFVNVPAVTSEDFGDEIVVVNFESGRYHSLQGSGVFVWRLLEGGAALDEIVERCCASFTAESREVRGTIKPFLAELEREGLIVLRAREGTPVAWQKVGMELHDELPRFDAPVLSTFSDMQELLWLDPIHEVDDAGWPEPKR